MRQICSGFMLAQTAGGAFNSGPDVSSGVAGKNNERVVASRKKHKKTWIK